MQGRIIEKRDPDSIGAEAAWIVIMAIPALVAWWQGWTITSWIFAALTLLSVIFTVNAYLSRNDTKWATTLTFDNWPVALGSHSAPLLNIEAYQSPPNDQTLEVSVKITCEERYHRKTNSSDYGDHGDYERKTVVDLEETYTAPLVAGVAKTPLQLWLPMDRGAPSQKIRVKAYHLYEVAWSISVTVEPIGMVVMDDELEIGAYVIAGDHQ